MKVTAMFQKSKDTIMGNGVENLDSVTRLISVLNNTQSLKCFVKL